MTFTREDRYLVLKYTDVQAVLVHHELNFLLGVARKVAEYREGIGKPLLECVVVESDWPEYEPTWNAIQTRMTET